MPPAMEPAVHMAHSLQIAAGAANASAINAESGISGHMNASAKAHTKMITRPARPAPTRLAPLLHVLVRLPWRVDEPMIVEGS